MTTNSSFQDRGKENLTSTVGADYSEWIHQNGSRKRANHWLSSSIWDSVQLKALLEDNPKYISSFDICKDSIVIGSNTSDILLLENINF